MKRIAVLGSTGSIGTQALKFIGLHPDKFRVTALTGNTYRALLAEQAARFKPAFTGVGEAAINASKSYDADTVLIAVAGIAGLRAVLNAVKYKVKRIALANKESIVAGGELLLTEIRRAGTELVPVDSEHSAVFQCLQGDKTRDVKRVILTASGGPFLRRNPDTLDRATKADVLKHPTFSMGAKITVDSATMMNKGLEMIEAKRLFSLSDEQIEAVVHTQSIIHSMVEFTDGSHFAQMSYPDMEIPIAYALTYPERLPTAMSARPLDFASLKALTFEPLSEKHFPCFALAKAAMRAEGVMPASLIAADEEAVAAFLNGRIRFTQIYDIIDRVMNKIGNMTPQNFDDIFAAYDEAVSIARDVIK